MRRPLSIGVVAPLVAPLAAAQPYGNHIFLVDLARGLAARGHEVVVYAAEGSRADGIRMEPIAVARAAQGCFAILGAANTAAKHAMRAAFARLFDRVRTRGHDVISQHAFDREAFDEARGLPVLHTLHLPPLRDGVVRAARECGNALAAVSHACARSWRAACSRAVLAIPNGIPRIALPPLGGSVQPVVLVAGRISREKGIAAAVRIARRAGLGVRLVGEIYDRDYFAREVKPQLKPGEFLPAVPRPELWQIMQQSAVTLMPVEWDEPFGLVAAEAQLCGCPVVAYHRGALPEIVQPGLTGELVEPGDEEAFVAATRAALALDRASIRRAASRRFSMDACVSRYERALGAVVEESLV